MAVLIRNRDYSLIANYKRDAADGERSLEGELGDALAGMLPRKRLGEEMPATPRTDVFVIACALQHTVYDCYYLRLSEQRDIKMATADEKLRSRCGGTRFEARLIDWRS